VGSDDGIVGWVHVDSAQILILDPVRLKEVQYDSVVRGADDRKAAEVWIENEEGEITIENFLDPPRRTNDGVVIATGSDGSFPITIEYGSDGEPASIRISLR
jgi:hypothetical protein